jgi:hypothetical protein
VQRYGAVRAARAGWNDTHAGNAIRLPSGAWSWATTLGKLSKIASSSGNEQHTTSSQISPHRSGSRSRRQCCLSAMAAGRVSRIDEYAHGA